MNWDIYKEEKGLEEEFQHLSYSWNDDDEIELDFTDNASNNAISERESDLLSEIWEELDNTLLTRRSNINRGLLKDASFSVYLNNFFTEDEAIQCEESLFKFYTLCRNAVAQKKSWLGFASFFEELSGLNPEGNRLLSFIESPRIKKIIQYEINELVLFIKQLLLSAKMNCHETNSICSNLILFSTETLIFKFDRIQGKGMRDNRIDFLFKVRDTLNNEKVKSARSHFSLSTKDRIFLAECKIRCN